MHRELIDKLSVITPEEQAALNGKKVDLFLYNSTGETVVEPEKLLPDGAMFGIRTHTRFVDFPRHGHRYVEMIYQVTGETNHRINGVTELTLKAGQLLLLGRGTEHEVKAAGKQDIAVNFLLIPAFFDNAAISIGGNGALSVFLKGNLNNKKLMCEHLIFDINGSRMIENLLENLILEELEGKSEKLQRLTLEVLFQHLSRGTEKLVVQSREGYEQAVVLSVISQIENQVRVNLSEIAEQVGMDITVLSRMIQKYTGCTFIELLHTARFNKAVTLLRDTELSVSDIAVMIGYENSAFFYRRFSKLYGCTPGEFRKSHRG